MSENIPHRRRNPLTGEWVLVSPQRMTRPWQGERSAPARSDRLRHDPGCYLCPGNERAGQVRNPEYAGTMVFPNDFPALLMEESADGHAADPSGLFVSEAARGEARVICFSPDHSLTLARMDDAARADVVDTWCNLSAELGEHWAHVQIFENKGAMMGASSPHPHGQAWAGDFVPTLVEREDTCQRTYAADRGQPLLSALVEAELSAGERVVAVEDDWLAILPFWASWPFELLIVARSDIRRLEDMTEPARISLARLLGRVLGACDRLFETDFPYSMGWHGAPHGLDDGDTAHWRLHAHVYPPLLRSAEVRKHMVGFELLGEVQRDLTPEAAAERLRKLVI